MLFDPYPNPAFLDPIQALRSLQAQFVLRRSASDANHAAPLAVALYQREGSLLLRTPLASVEAKDVSIEVDGNLLTLSGQFAAEPDEAGASARHVERPRGCFTRTLHLPFEIDAGRVQARLEHGVLEVELPRLQKSAPVKIEVQSEGTRN